MKKTEQERSVAELRQSNEEVHSEVFLLRKQTAKLELEKPRQCDESCKALVGKLSSKRPQSQELDIPESTLGKYVFVPTQKFLDGVFRLSVFVDEIPTNT